jgi:hypothetical protein
MRIKKSNKLLNKNKLKLDKIISKNNGRILKISIKKKLKNQTQKLNKLLKKLNTPKKFLLVKWKSNRLNGLQKKNNQKKIVTNQNKHNNLHPHQNFQLMEMVENGQ